MTSIAELLPRPFDQLGVDDVEAIVRGPAEERESIVLELKGELRGDLVAKSCTAFANTIGGLLVVGVSDAGELRGLDDDVGEAQLWVKDVLRSRVLPLPPFRARRLDLENGRWILLVLVEESSTTPHLLTRQGAIYVRNPGSSDPRPLGDQGLLLDLLRRGERSRSEAAERAHRALSWSVGLPEHVQGPRRRVSLTLAATGVAESFDDRLLREPAGLDLLTAALPDDAGPRAWAVQHVWEQHALTALKVLPRAPVRPDRVEIIRIHRDGVALYQLGFRGELRQGDEYMEENVDRDELVASLRRMFEVTGRLLLNLGAHGELRLGVRIEAPRRISWTPGQLSRVDDDILIALATALELDEERVDDVLARIVSEIGRALGVPPQF